MAKTMARERLKKGEVVQLVGGFFACTNADQQALSGPWKSEAAAVLAGKGDYVGAHREERDERIIRG